MTMADRWLDEVSWNRGGLVPALVQDAHSGRMLMLAWMSRDSMRLTVETGQAVYWSRSRNKLWHKGEQSGHHQLVREIRLDCDSDTVLLTVEQAGGIACHTGRASCFFRRLENGIWRETEAPLVDPRKIYP